MKTGFWLRNGKGKLAGATVYQDGNGNTVMREVVSPTNPKTQAQMVQRIIMHTVMQAYSKMKEICDHSFEGVKKGQDTMSLFMKENVQKCRAAVAEMQAQGVSFINMFNFSLLGTKNFAANQYLVAMGSLPRVTTQWVEDSTILYPTAQGITTNTYESVIQSLGLKRGDQLTFCIVTEGANNLTEFHFARVILDPTTSDFQPAPLSSPLVDAQGAITFPSVRNEGTANFKFTMTANGLRYQYEDMHSVADDAIAAYVIVSRKLGDTWQRSTTFMSYPGSLPNSASLGECLEAAQGTQNSIYTGADAYLNNAGTGGGAGSAEDSGNSGNTQSNSFAISSAAVNNEAITVGTPKVQTLSEGEDEMSLDIRVTFSNKGDASAIIVEKNGAQVGTDHELSGNAANFSIANATVGTYTIKVKKSDNTVSAPGYSVTVQAYSSGGGYDPNYGDIGDGN